MSRQTLNLDEKLYQYLLSVSLRESPLLKQLREETSLHSQGRMQISPEQGQFMALLIQLLKVKKALEIGVFTGYSSLAIAKALPEDGKLIACDISEEFTKTAINYWQKANVSHKIELNIAPALETLARLSDNGENETFDFIFIDADKTNYDLYYEKSLELLKQGGLILIDNTLWYGRVADVTIQDKQTKHIRALNEKIYQDSRVNMSLLPIGDGLTLAMKK